MDFNGLNVDSLVIAALGYVVVFSALVLLYLVFHNLPKLLHMRIRKRMIREGKGDRVTEHSVPIAGEVNAAIATALYLYMNELHDPESNIITIKRISRAYSPWSSKIYAVRNYFNRQ